VRKIAPKIVNDLLGCLMFAFGTKLNQISSDYFFSQAVECPKFLEVAKKHLSIKM
jgi:hypothetical protein